MQMESRGSGLHVYLLPYVAWGQGKTGGICVTSSSLRAHDSGNIYDAMVPGLSYFISALNWYVTSWHHNLFHEIIQQSRF